MRSSGNMGVIGNARKFLSGRKFGTEYILEWEESVGRLHRVSQDKLGHKRPLGGGSQWLTTEAGFWLRWDSRGSAQGSGQRTHPLPRTLPISWQRGQRTWPTTAFGFKQDIALLLTSVTWPSLSSDG